MVKDLKAGKVKASNGELRSSLRDSIAKLIRSKLQAKPTVNVSVHEVSTSPH